MTHKLDADELFIHRVQQHCAEQGLNFFLIEPALTGMKFFSSEVALSEAGEFVLIDYVNDQCHMLSQSANPRIGVPDELVAAIARRLIEATKELIAKNR